LGVWEDLTIRFVADRLEVYVDGEARFAQTLFDTPGAGAIAFVTQSGQRARLDDCLLLAVPTLDEGA
jgi:hypothetical protein